MPAWWIVLVVVLVVASFGVALLPNEVRVYRRARGRRGGLLELDTAGARSALGDPDDWFSVHRSAVTGQPTGLLVVRRQAARDALLEHGAPAAYVEGISPLRRCNPAKKIHFHGAGDRCQCGERPNVMPFAGGGAA